MIAISSRTQNRLKWLFHKLEYCIYMAPATARYKTHELRPFPIRMDRLQVDIILFILFWGERRQTIKRSLHPSPIHPYNRYQSNCVGILSSKKQHKIWQDDDDGGGIDVGTGLYPKLDYVNVKKLGVGAFQSWPRNWSYPNLFLESRCQSTLGAVHQSVRGDDFATGKFA